MSILKRWTIIGSVTLSLATVIVTTPESLSAVKAEPECVKADRWVAAHRDNLPSTFEGLQQFSVPFQRRIVAALPVEQQGQLWREHLAAMATSRILTPTQQSIVASLDTTLARLFDPDASIEERRKRLAPIDAYLQAQFDPTLYRAVFTFEGLSTRGGAWGKVDQSGDCTCTLGGPPCHLGPCQNWGCSEILQCGAFAMGICDGVCFG